MHLTRNHDIIARAHADLPAAEQAKHNGALALFGGIMAAAKGSTLRRLTARREGRSVLVWDVPTTSKWKDAEWPFFTRRTTLRDPGDMVLCPEPRQ